MVLIIASSLVFCLNSFIRCLTFNEFFQALTDHNFTKRYNKVQLTKKLDCPAVVNVSRIIWIPEHKVCKYKTIIIISLNKNVCCATGYK